MPSIERASNTFVYMTQNELKNFLLKEMIELEKEINIAEVLHNLQMELPNNEVGAIEADLYRQGYVTIVPGPNKERCLRITTKGKEFISKGGFMSKEQVALAYSMGNSINSLSKMHQDRKTSAEIKQGYLKIKTIFESLQSKIGVISNEELRVEIAPLTAIYEDLYGGLASETMKCKLFVKEASNFKREGLPFLKETMERLGQKLKQSPLDIHPKIKKAAEELFNNGHYRQAVYEAFLCLDNEIQRKTGLDTYGTDLMNIVFSSKAPKLKMSDNAEEQTGVLFLFAGSVKAIRNRYAHKDIKLTDKNFTIDLLHFASALMTLVDDPQVY